MKCPQCQVENPTDARFCSGCGQKLELACKSCGKANPPESRFCNGCGNSLALPPAPSPQDLSFDEKIAKLQKYLPSGITEKILSQRDKIEGEKRHVTVLFCDMEGFTPLSDKLGPETMYAMMDGVYEILIRKVHDYEGTVNEMTGDGIMALFGAPIALEDAPQRALRSAMSIHREMTRFNEKVKWEKGDLPNIKMRIGIHTGPVVVGTLGNDLRVEFKAVGDTVNLAARMEQLAEPGTTYVTEDTFKLTEGYFRFEDLGDREIKGKKKSIHIYRVIAPSTRRTRFDVNAERGLTPFVGRQRELELLLDGYERTKEGRGQAISIISEAGIGKSRLLYEFRKAVTNDDVTFREGRCLSYSRNVAYHPVVDLLKANFDIQDTDTEQEIREKVTKGLQFMKIDESSILPYLLELLSVKESGIDDIPLSPEAKKERTIEALNKIILRGSEIRPLIMVIEDLHWMDRSSGDTMKNLLESIAGARVLLIFTYRPEFVHTWGSRTYHSQVTLNRLSNRETLTMATHILGIPYIERGLEDLILQKAEGVPFFIEEFIKSLQELRIIERKDKTYQLSSNIEKLSIPSTIQDVILARVDALPEGAKEVVRTGSVIEREFSNDLIRRVTALPEQELLSHLSAIKNSEILYERGLYPNSTYIFKHALTRDVIYDSILFERKKKLHEKIGRAIEFLHQENINEYSEILAHHFFNCQTYSKAAEFYKLASKKAERTASLNDAISYGKKRVYCLEKLPRTDDAWKKIIDTRTIVGLYLTQMNYFVDAREAIVSIFDLAIKNNHKKRLPQLYTIIGTYNYMVEEDFPEAFNNLEVALNISEEEHDTLSLFFINFWLGIALSLNCEFERAFGHFQKTLDINIAANNLWGISAIKSMISFFVYYFQGKADHCFHTTDEAVQMAEKSGDVYSKAFAYFSHGISCYCKGFPEEAKKYLLEGEKFCERINFFSFNALTHQYLGEIYFDTGEYQKSKEHYDKAVLLTEHNRFLPSLMMLNRIGVARSKIREGAKDIKLDLLYKYLNENKIKFHDSLMTRYVVNCLLEINDLHISDAEELIKKTVKIDKKRGMTFFMAKDYALYAELLKKRGDRTKAKEKLGRAIEIYKSCGATGWLKKAEEEMATLS